MCQGAAASSSSSSSSSSTVMHVQLWPLHSVAIATWRVRVLGVKGVMHVHATRVLPTPYPAFAIALTLSSCTNNAALHAFYSSVVPSTPHAPSRINPFLLAFPL